MNDQQVRAYFDRLADAVEVGPAPVDAVLEARTGHRVRIVFGVAVAGLVAAAVLAAALSNRTDGPPRPVDPATVTDSVGPIESQSGNGAWWTPGSIHFGTGTLPFDDVDDPADDVGWMVPAPDGVIVGRVDGTIAAVETSGRVTELGRYRTSGQTGQGPSFFVDRTDGLIAWTDGDRLFVYDPASRTVVAERDDSARYPHAAWLLGFDGGKVYWDDRYGDRIWDWAADTTRRVGGGPRLTSTACATAVGSSRSIAGRLMGVRRGRGRRRRGIRGSAARHPSFRNAGILAGWRESRRCHRRPRRRQRLRV